MSIDACAALVARGDPDRFAAAMTAPPEGRPGLLALYALNLELARAPWVTSDPMLAQIRIQWWADALTEVFDGQPPRRHEVMGPLAETIRTHSLPRAPFEALIAGRRDEVDPGAPVSPKALWRRLEDTAGSLVLLAARTLGAPEDTDPTARTAGAAQGAAALIAALPALTAAGRTPLPPPGGASALATLATEARRRLAEARGAGASIPGPALPAFRTGFRADAILARALADPAAALTRPAGPSDLRARLTLIRRTGFGTW